MISIASYPFYLSAQFALYLPQAWQAGSRLRGEENTGKPPAAGRGCGMSERGRDPALAGQDTGDFLRNLR